jgi:hypothetical protein
MGLFDGDPTCRFCRKETETVQHIICCCEASARQRYNVFGNPLVEPKDISTASVRNLCLFISGRGLLNPSWMEYLGLHNKPKAEVHLGHKLTGPKEEEEGRVEWSDSHPICFSPRKIAPTTHWMSARVDSGIQVLLHSFLISALGGVEWSDSCPICFSSRKIAPTTHWISARVDSRASLDVS